MKIDSIFWNITGKAQDFYAKFETTLEAWEACDRGDWMLEFAEKLGLDKRKLVGCAGECAALLKHLIKDKRSLDAIDACAKYAAGEIGEKELRRYAAAADEGWHRATEADAMQSEYAASCAAYGLAGRAAEAVAEVGEGKNNTAQLIAPRHKACASIVRKHLTSDLIKEIEKYKQNESNK